MPGLDGWISFIKIFKNVSHLKTEGIGNHASSNTLRRRSQTKRRWQKTGANFDWLMLMSFFLVPTIEIGESKKGGKIAFCYSSREFF